MTFLKNDPRPCPTLKQVFLDHFELVVAHFGFAKTTSKHANTRQNTHVSCGTSRQCAASSWGQCAASSWAVTKARYGQ